MREGIGLSGESTDVIGEGRAEKVSPDFSFVLGPDERGQRLDSCLSRRCKELSRNQIKKLIQGGKVLVNDRVVKPGYETRPGDRIWGWLPVIEDRSVLLAESIPLSILFEDEDILVLNKPPGLVVHPGAGNRDGTLVHGLLAHCSHLPIQGAPLRPGIVHRLDKDTSGVMVVAKSGAAYLDLISQFSEHEVRKAYLALVYGNLVKSEGEIISNVGRHPVNRKKMAVLPQRGREAISRWRVEREWDGLTLLNIRIETGRTHQIRVQFSHLQHPVVGDAEYGGGKRRARLLKSKVLQDLLLQAERQMLHAFCLAFRHPRTRELLSFTAPLPLDFAELLAALDRL
jgi:23S rRNA pseudouridine1911/1915/1917 synthase